jgi:hypothetical protein
MAQEYSQVNFRIPTKLKEDIEKAAQANNRSITSELVSRLEKSFEDSYRENFSDAVITELLESTLSKLLSSMKDQGVPDDKIHNALVDLTNKKAP